VPIGNYNLLKTKNVPEASKLKNKGIEAINRFGSHTPVDAVDDVSPYFRAF
jgi:hypothetical protein